MSKDSKVCRLKNSDNELGLPDFINNCHSNSDNVYSVEGTNVVRVPFGKRFSRKKRPEKNQSIATLILPISSFTSPLPPNVA